MQIILRCSSCSVLRLSWMTDCSPIFNTYDSNETGIKVSKQVPYFVFGQNEKVLIGVYMTLPPSKKTVSLSVLLIMEKNI